MPPLLLRTLKDPLFVFCLLGAGCFLLFDALAEDREAIVVSPAIRDMLIDDFMVLEGRSPDVEEQAALIERFVNDEILFREALDRGLHFGDPRLRLQLIEKMRFVLADLPPEPSEETLLAYYMEHLARYRSEPRYSLRNIYFQSRPEQPDAVLEALRAGHEVSGDSGYWLGAELQGYHASMLRNVLGPEVLPTLEGMARGDWAGPIASPRGYHFIRLDDMIPSRPLRYEDVRVQVQEDYHADRRRASIAERLEVLRSGYAIRILPAADA